MESTEYITFLFNIRYETRQGENIYIFGSNKDFGEWKEQKFKLHWTPNHIWEGEYRLPKNSPIIKYKFVCVSYDKKIWENGPNRLLSASSLNGLETDSKGRYILKMIWEHFNISFNIYFPLKSNKQVFQIVGEPQALANWLRKEEKPIRMELSQEKEIVAKDGNAIKGRFWTVTILMRIDNPRNIDFEYRYSIYNEETNTAIWEREPNRRLKLIMDNENQEGMEEIKSNPDQNKLLVNSYLNHLDVNFVANLAYNRMGDKNIYIGPYPQTFNDFEELAKAKITAILNLQTDKDLLHRQINNKAQTKECASLGINLVRYPIEDFDQEDLELKLKGAGDKLKELLDEGKSVYVHCTAGMSRAAATVIIYLVLHEDYSVEAARKFVKEHRSIICPNYAVINNVVLKYKPDKIEVLPEKNTAESIMLN